MLTQDELGRPLARSQEALEADAALLAGLRPVGGALLPLLVWAPDQGPRQVRDQVSRGAGACSSS